MTGCTTAITFSQHLLHVRILQLLLASIYLILLAYSAANRGWWLHLKSALGFGFSASLISMLTAIPNFLKYRPRITNATKALTVNILRVCFELFLGALWGAAFVCMLLPKGKDFRYAFVRPPYGTWDAGAAVAIAEV